MRRRDLPVVLAAGDGALVLRAARLADVPAVAALLADDEIGAERGNRTDGADPTVHDRAFRAIEADPSNVLLVGVIADRVVVTLQLTVIPGMARGGATRLQVEAVRVGSEHRSGGVGSAVMRWVVEGAAPALRADLVQLTSDGRRADAHRFYERLGFAASHVGFKLGVERSR